MPTVAKEGDSADTGLSRAYRVRIAYGRPADNVPNDGLRSRSVTINYTPARRRTVTISGTYTAVSGTDARAKYQASIASLASTVLSAIDNTANFELVDETDGPNSTNDKVLDFSRTYEEILYSQAGSSNSTTIVRQSLKIRLRDVAPGDTPEVRRLGVFDATYSAWIDAEQTTDLAGQWATIQSWVVTQVQTASGVSQLAVVDRSVTYDYDDNRIDATMTFHGVRGDDRIENAVHVEDDDQRGVQLLPVWTGNPIDRLEFQGPRDYTRRVTSRTVFLGEKSISNAYNEAASLMADTSQGPPPSAGITGGSWRVLRVTPKITKEKRGLTDISSTFIYVTVVETTSVRQWINTVSGPGTTNTPSGNNATTQGASTP